MVRAAAKRQPQWPPLTGPVDVNSASAEQLRRVPGVGPRTADRLLTIRQTRRLRLRDLQRLNVEMSRAKPFVITADHRPAPFTQDKFANDMFRESRPAAERRQLPLF